MDSAAPITVKSERASVGQPVPPDTKPLVAKTEAPPVVKTEAPPVVRSATLPVVKIDSQPVVKVEVPTSPAGIDGEEGEEEDYGEEEAYFSSAPQDEALRDIKPQIRGQSAAGRSIEDRKPTEHELNALEEEEGEEEDYEEDDIFFPLKQAALVGEMTSRDEDMEDDEERDEDDEEEDYEPDGWIEGGRPQMWRRANNERPMDPCHTAITRAPYLSLHHLEARTKMTMSGRLSNAPQSKLRLARSHLMRMIPALPSRGALTASSEIISVLGLLSCIGSTNRAMAAS